MTTRTKDAYKAKKTDAFRARAAAAEETDDGDKSAAADQRDRYPVDYQHRRRRIVLEQHAY